MDKIIDDDFGYSISIREVPTSIGALINLEHLVICGESELTTLPHSIGSLKSLVELNVSCIGIIKFPNTIVNLKSLKVLKMNKSGMKKLPEVIGELEKLEEIYGEDCNQQEMIPGDIERLPSLKILKLKGIRVENVAELPQSLEVYVYPQELQEKL
ncbi:hypothetical protein NL676_035159 [Syzygium grande]|nr:hypothetical protein NL676_035159 [Syzygium grande]